jgi:hypothetical protein
MEVKETAACGIAQREFAIEFDDDEFNDMYRVVRYIEEGVGFYDEDFVEELSSQMLYIIGPSVEEDPPDTILDDKMEWEDTGASFALNFNDETATKLNQILKAVEHPGEGFDEEMRKRIADGMMELNPTQLENLPLINR